MGLNGVWHEQKKIDMTRRKPLHLPTAKNNTKHRPEEEETNFALLPV